MPVITWWLKIGYWLYANTRFGKWYFNKTLRHNNELFPFGHSAVIKHTYGDFNVAIIPYSKDNYGFVIWKIDSNTCIIIDPGYFVPIKEFITQNKLKIDAVLVTHKHYDHCNDVDVIVSLYPNIKVYANRYEKVKNATHIFSKPVTHIKSLCNNQIDVVAHHTPGHTVGHTIYSICTSPSTQIKSKILSTLMSYEDPRVTNKVETSGDTETRPTRSSFHNCDDCEYILVFSGDCIFLGSIGAMFEGTVKQTLNTLGMFIKNLIQTCIPTNRILIFPGHEYSLNSLPFVLYNCTPYSSLARKKLSWCEEQRKWHIPTIPVTLFDELSYSPFLRIALANAPGKSRVCLEKQENEQIKKYYMPNLIEIMHEMMVSFTFLKTEKKEKESEYGDFVNFKLKLFTDLFNQGPKTILRCEGCAPEPLHTSFLKDTNLPKACLAEKPKK